MLLKNSNIIVESPNSCFTISFRDDSLFALLLENICTVLFHSINMNILMNLVAKNSLRFSTVIANGIFRLIN